MIQRVEDVNEKITPEQFVYWLAGFLEISDSKSITAKQTQIIKDHLDLVFKKVTPNYKVTSAMSYPNGVRDASSIPDVTYTPNGTNTMLC